MMMISDDGGGEIVSCRVFQYFMFRCQMKLWLQCFKLISLTVPAESSS